MVRFVYCCTAVHNYKAQQAILFRAMEVVPSRYLILHLVQNQIFGQVMHEINTKTNYVATTLLDGGSLDGDNAIVVALKAGVIILPN